MRPPAALKTGNGRGWNLRAVARRGVGNLRDWAGYPPGKENRPARPAMLLTGATGPGRRLRRGGWRLNVWPRGRPGDGAITARPGREG